MEGNFGANATIFPKLMDTLNRHYRENAISLSPSSILPIFIIVASPLGIIGNVGLFAAITFSKAFSQDSRYTPSVKWLIQVLALACLMCCCLLIFWPSHYMSNIFNPSSWSFSSCPMPKRSFSFAVWIGKVEWSLEEAFSCFVNHVLTLMSLDTYMAVKWPHIYRDAYQTSPALKYTTLGLAVYSLCLCMPYLAYFSIKPIEIKDPWNTGSNRTTFYTMRFNEHLRSFTRAYDVVTIVMVYLVPCLIIMVLNCLTCYYYRNLAARRKRRSNRVGVSAIPTRLSQRRFWSLRSQGEAVAQQVNNVPSPKMRLKNLIIITGTLTMITFTFSVPWIFFVLIKSSTWKAGLKFCKSSYQNVSYCLIFTKFYVFPYLIILGNRFNRDKIINRIKRWKFW